MEAVDDDVVAFACLCIEGDDLFTAREIGDVALANAREARVTAVGRDPQVKVNAVLGDP